MKKDQSEFIKGSQTALNLLHSLYTGTVQSMYSNPFFIKKQALWHIAEKQRSPDELRCRLKTDFLRISLAGVLLNYHSSVIKLGDRDIASIPLSPKQDIVIDGYSSRFVCCYAPAT